MKKFSLILLFLLGITIILPSKANASTGYYCLAEAIYFEARNQPFKGQVAVANVILNRVKSNKYPNDICSVVHQKNNNTCQFSYVCEDNLVIKNKSLFDRFIIIAKKIIQTGIDITNGSTHYHANYVNPRWSNYLEFSMVIQDHIFYK